MPFSSKYFKKNVNYHFNNCYLNFLFHVLFFSFFRIKIFTLIMLFLHNSSIKFLSQCTSRFCLTSVFQIFCERSLVKIIVDPNSSICSIFFDDVNVPSLFFGKFLSFLIFITSVETSGIAQFLITA